MRPAAFTNLKNTPYPNITENFTDSQNITFKSYSADGTLGVHGTYQTTENHLSATETGDQIHSQFVFSQATDAASVTQTITNFHVDGKQPRYPESAACRFRVDGRPPSKHDHVRRQCRDPGSEQQCHSDPDGRHEDRDEGAPRRLFVPWVGSACPSRCDAPCSPTFPSTTSMSGCHAPLRSASVDWP